jgi:5-methylcytosine-specific restriction protein A
VSTARRINGVWSTPRPFGPNGEKLCYNCGGLLPKGKPYNCSRKCSESWRMKTSPSHVRFVLRNRDHGVCALCGLDTIALKKEYNDLRRDGFSEHSQIRDEFRKAHGIPAGRASSDWWDADHIVPVIEGGGACGPENYRTLCIPCHQQVTRELHSRAKRRRVEAMGQTSLFAVSEGKRPEDASSHSNAEGSLDEKEVDKTVAGTHTSTHTF